MVKKTLLCLEPELLSVLPRGPFPLCLANLNSWFSFRWWLRRQEYGGFLAATLLLPWEQTLVVVSARQSGNTGPQRGNRVVSTLHGQEYRMDRARSEKVVEYHR